MGTHFGSSRSGLIAQARKFFVGSVSDSSELKLTNTANATQRTPPTQSSDKKLGVVAERVHPARESDEYGGYHGTDRRDH